MRIKLPASGLPRESEVQKSIIAYLEMLGAVVVRVNSGLLPRADGGRMRCNHSKSGSVSDVLACFRGRFLAIEVKRSSKGVATEGQSAFLAAVRSADGIGIVASSIEDVRKALESA